MQTTQIIQIIYVMQIAHASRTIQAKTTTPVVPVQIILRTNHKRPYRSSKAYKSLRPGTRLNHTKSYKSHKSLKGVVSRVGTAVSRVWQ